MTRGILLALALAIVACDSGSPLEPPRIGVEVVGRLERGLEVRLRTVRDGVLVAADRVNYTAPSTQVQILGDGRARLLEAGPVTITAETDGARAHVEIVVEAPPTILFDRRVDGNQDVFRAALDGRDVVRLTTSAADDLEPTSAAGRVVFVSYRDSAAELYRVPLAGGAEERLTTTPAGETSPTLSRDGARLAFTSDVTGTPRLWTANGDARDASPATTGSGFAGALEAGPDWSPSGERLAFVATHQGSADVYALRTLDRTIERLTSERTAEVEPSWSPDGRYVVFASDREGTTSLYVLELATGEVRRLTRGEGTEGQPAWLPDGRVVFTTFSDGGSRLGWVDPADPQTVYPVPVGDGAANPAAAR